MAIELEGTKIDDLPLDEIVRRAAKPEHAIYVGGDRMDYFRNRDLLKLFGGDGIFPDSEFLTTEGVVERLVLFPGGGYSREFSAIRLGETTNWACQHGIVRRCPNDIWQLALREPQFELCGPERKQVAVRVRGLTGEAAIAADRIWQRELKRRERARAKYVAGVIETINIEIDFISRHAPETKLPETLARFAVGEHDTVVSVRELITDAVPALSTADATALGQAVHAVYLPIMQVVIDRAAEERKRQREEARAAEDAELAALAAMFPEPPPPPPPPPPETFPAEVRTRHERGGYMGSMHYEVEGSLEDVKRTIEMAEERFFDGLNVPYFQPPVEIAEGRWLARGRRSCGTD